MLYLSLLRRRSPVTIAAGAIYFATLALDLRMSAKGIILRVQYTRMSTSTRTARATALVSDSFVYLYRTRGRSLALADIGLSAGVADSTIKQTYKQMLQYSKTVFPSADFTPVVPLNQLPNS